VRTLIELSVLAIGFARAGPSASAPWPMDVAPSGLRFRVFHDPAIAALNYAASHMNHALGHGDVVTAQLGQLAEPQRSTMQRASPSTGSGLASPRRSFPARKWMQE
jgi:hypothetical protein